MINGRLYKVNNADEYKEYGWEVSGDKWGYFYECE